MALKSFLKQCTRVWILLKKPSKKEFMTTSKVAAIGLGLVGLIGFIVGLFMEFFGLV